jgi:uncharacterized protein YndB with AHSA1/START domain
VTASDDPADVVVIRRMIPVPREQVFAAWLDPASLAQWMRPGDVVSATAEVDARVGGRFRIVMTHGRGDPEHWGEYIAIEPPSLLSFTWASASTDQQPTMVTVEFHERDGGTELVLTHRHVPRRQIDPHRKGWGDIVRKLDETLTAAAGERHV